MMKRDQYLHILCYLHFTDNRNEPGRTDENFDRLWKIRDLFEILNSTFSKFYNPSENLTVDEVIVSFKGRVIFRQYIPRKHKCFGIKIFKLCDLTGYTYDMKVYLGKDRQRTAQHVTATHATVTELTRKIEGRGHKLYTWTISFLPLNYFMTWRINRFTVVALSGQTGEACHKT